MLHPTNRIKKHKNKKEFSYFSWGSIVDTVDAQSLNFCFCLFLTKRGKWSSSRESTRALPHFYTSNCDNKNRINTKKKRKVLNTTSSNLQAIRRLHTHTPLVIIIIIISPSSMCSVRQRNKERQVSSSSRTGRLGLGEPSKSPFS